MRHDSERVPGKNYRLIDGLPLYHYIVRSLGQCPEIDTILIDTDSPVILEDARRHFPDVVCYERPQHLRDGHLSMTVVLENSIKQVDADYYLQTHSTNPLLKPSTVSAAVSRLLDAQPGHDSLFSVTRIQRRLWDAECRPVNHDPEVLLRTQDLPPLYEENSCLYLFRAEVLRQRNNRIGASPLQFEIDRLEAVDIDEEPDFRLAEYLLRDRRLHGVNLK